MYDGAPSVLLGWELGGGLGHVQRLLLLADALASRGFRPVLALRDLIGPRPLLRACPFSVLQAPLYSATGRAAPSGFVARSYADILAVHGFADADHLLAMTQAWLALLDLVRPAVVVADHSPTLCLAASGVFPTVQIGNGFLNPPTDQAAFPVLMTDRPALMDEARLLDAVREVQRQLGRPVAPTLPGLFASAGRFVTVIPELDPYHEVRREPVFGPIRPIGPPLPPPERPGFFAYLSAEMPCCEAILTSLAQTGFPGRAYVLGADLEGRDRLRRLGLEVFDQPGPLNEMLAQSAVIVSQGNLGMAHAALAAGRPQLLFPAHLEQLMNARRLQALGVAHYLTGQFPAADIGEGLRQLLTDPIFRRRAQEAAVAVQARGPYNPLPAIVAHCEQWLHGRPTAGPAYPIHIPVSRTPKESVP
jgi:Erythromycin biosynthesis protein CIII-like, C-terminal domain